MDTIIDPFPIWDTVEEKGYNCTDTLDLLVDLLNELYGEMERFGEHNYKLEQYNLHYLNENTRLKEENEQLKQEVFVYKKAFQQQVQRCSL